MQPDDPIEAIVEAVSSSSKYATIAPALIRHLAEIEYAKARKPKETIKAVKNRLHQVAGVYVEGRPHYADWLAALRAAESTDALKNVCRRLLGAHASSRERLDILETFYQTLLGDLQPISSVMDIACGLNPLAIPFMPLVAQARYLSVDVFDDLMVFLSEAIPLLGAAGKTYSLDVTREIPSETVDVALLIKAIPCLQQIDKAVGATLLEKISARYLIVSYPVRSLGGGEKGMRTFYADSFMKLVEGKSWTVERFDFDDELVFRVTKELPLPTG